MELGNGFTSPFVELVHARFRCKMGSFQFPLTYLHLIYYFSGSVNHVQTKQLPYYENISLQHPPFFLRFKC